MKGRNRIDPCKFCGHKPNVKFSSFAGGFVAACFNGECSVLPEVWGGTRDEVIRTWNGKSKDSSTTYVRIGAVGWSNLLKGKL